MKSPDKQSAGSLLRAKHTENSDRLITAFHWSQILLLKRLIKKKKMTVG